MLAPNFQTNDEEENQAMKSPYRMLLGLVALLVAVGCLCSNTGLTSTTTPATSAPATSAPIATKESAPPSINTPESQPPSNGGTTGSGLVTFVDQNKLLSFDLPGDWTYKNVPSDNFYTDVFTSPDEAGKIESLVYNDGTAFSGKDNGKFALYLLNTFYSKTGKVGDIRISSDQIMQDGSERLEWSSRGGGYSGVSFFETRGSDNKTFLMLTAWWVDGADQGTIDAINNAIASYAIP